MSIYLAPSLATVRDQVVIPGTAAAVAAAMHANTAAAQAAVGRVGSVGAGVATAAATHALTSATQAAVGRVGSAGAEAATAAATHALTSATQAAVGRVGSAGAEAATAVSTRALLLAVEAATKRGDYAAALTALNGLGLNYVELPQFIKLKRLLQVRQQRSFGNIISPTPLGDNDPHDDVPLLPLTPREQAILDLLARYRTNLQIAEALSLSLSSVKNAIRDLFSKLDARSRREVVRIARQRDLLTPAPLVVPPARPNIPLPPGWRRLSEREQELALLLTDPVCAGYTEMRLAVHVGIAVGTLRKHFQRIYCKLRVNNRASVVAIALRVEGVLNAASQRGEL